jgi:glycosyltransferase involved in cell wall biosynthesis
MDKYKITFCIPVYNTENTLFRCIDSVIKCGLNKDEYEIVIVNDGDNQIDLYRKMVNEYKDDGYNIQSIIHTKNMGLLEARRSSVLRSSGKYICVIDSDDYITENSISDLFKELEDEPDIIQCNFNIIGDIEDTMEHPMNSNIVNKHNLLSEAFILDIIPSYLWAKLIKREIYLKALEYIPQTYVNFTEDFLQMFFICSFSNYYLSKNAIKMYNYDRSNIKSITNIDKISINKVNNLLTFVNTFKIVSLKEFNNEELKNSIMKKYKSFLLEIYSSIILLSNPNDREKMKNKYIELFGLELFKSIKKTFESI